MRNLPDPVEMETNKAQFIKLVKNLAGLYESLKPAEKRIFIEYTFSNRTVIGKIACIEPCSWVQMAETGHGVPSGEPHRHTDRTFEVPEQLKIMFRLMFGDGTDDIGEAAYVIIRDGTSSEYHCLRRKRQKLCFCRP